MLPVVAVRLDEIADVAGVSSATVSRVLNNRAGVADGTRARVLAALDEMGYEPPPRLVARGTGLVGLVVPELTNPVFPWLAQALTTALGRRGLTAVLCVVVRGGTQEDAYVAQLLERQVSGIVFVAGTHAVVGSDPGRYTRLVDRGLPVALVNGWHDEVPVPFVSNDEAAGTEAAVEHLVALGHRRVGLVGGPGRYRVARRRLDAFRAAVHRHLGDDADADLVAEGGFHVEGGRRAAAPLLSGGATGLVCASDLMALGAVQAARAAGCSVPDDVSVVGADGSDLMEHVHPPLTTVRMDVGGIADAAVQVLHQDMEGLHPVVAEYLLRPELVVRASTAPAPDA